MSLNISKSNKALNQIITMDLAALELQVAEQVIGEDIYKLEAAELFDCSLEEVNLKMRTYAKRVKFYTLYGGEYYPTWL